MRRSPPTASTRQPGAGYSGTLEQSRERGCGCRASRCCRKHPAQVLRRRLVGVAFGAVARRDLEQLQVTGDYGATRVRFGARVRHGHRSKPLREILEP